MRRIVAFLLLPLLAVVGLVACGDDDTSASPSTTAAETTTSADSATPTTFDDQSTSDDPFCQALGAVDEADENTSTIAEEAATDWEGQQEAFADAAQELNDRYEEAIDEAPAELQDALSEFQSFVAQEVQAIRDSSSIDEFSQAAQQIPEFDAATGDAFEISTYASDNCGLTLSGS